MKVLLLPALLSLLNCPPTPVALLPAPPAIVPVVAAASADSTTLQLLYGTSNSELTTILRVLQIEQQRLSIRDARLAGKQFHLTFQEYRNGAPGPEKNLIASVPSRLTRFDSTGYFSMQIFSRQVSETKVENQFQFASGATVKTFEAVPRKGNLYSLMAEIRPFRRVRGAAGGPAENPVLETRLPLGEKVPLLVYTLPYDAGESLQYCTVAQSGIPVGEWYKRFRIPHFVVYNLWLE